MKKVSLFIILNRRKIKKRKLRSWPLHSFWLHPPPLPPLVSRPSRMYTFVTSILKVLTNEKRGGLKVVAFGRSPFKPFTLR